MFFIKPKKTYKVGDLISIPRGKTNTGSTRYVVAEILQIWEYPKFKTFSLKIKGCQRPHNFFPKGKEIREVSDGEAMLWKLENS